LSLISSSVTETLKFLKAGEVLWTPQKEDDILIDRKLFKDYPELSKCMFGNVVETLDLDKIYSD
jgi:uncharacterized membrane protein